MSGEIESTWEYRRWNPTKHYVNGGDKEGTWEYRRWNPIKRHYWGQRFFMDAEEEKFARGLNAFASEKKDEKQEVLEKLSPIPDDDEENS